MDGGDAGSDVVAFDQGAVADLEAGDVGDGVVGAWGAAVLQAEGAGARFAGGGDLAGVSVGCGLGMRLLGGHVDQGSWRGFGGLEGLLGRGSGLAWRSRTTHALGSCKLTAFHLAGCSGRSSRWWAAGLWRSW